MVSSMVDSSWYFTKSIYIYKFQILNGEMLMVFKFPKNFLYMKSHKGPFHKCENCENSDKREK